MAAVYKLGPLAVSVDAGGDFRFYSEGVFYNPQCATRSRDLDHAVLLVGYGTDDDSGQDYWLVRNSWSKYCEYLASNFAWLSLLGLCVCWSVGTMCWSVGTMWFRAHVFERRM